VKKYVADWLDTEHLGPTAVYLASEVDALREEILAFLKKSRRAHDYCEDSWYSCPKAEDGSCNDSKGDECDCGADKYNAKLDEMIAKVFGGES
jgi:hypothetical protein